MRLSLGLVIVISIGLCSCTTSLETAAPDKESISKGYAYQLPRLRYEVNVTRTLTECPETPSQVIHFDITATASSSLSQGETIVIDYLAVASATKTTEIVLKNHANGMLKTINLSVDDKTADIVKESVKAIAGIGKLVIGLPGGGVVSGVNDEPQLICSERASKALTSLPTLKAALKVAADEVKVLEKNLADLTSASTIGKPAKAETIASLAKELRGKIENREKAKIAYDQAVESITLLQRASFEIPNDGIVVLLEIKAATDGKSKPNELFEIISSRSKTKFFHVPLDNELKPSINNARSEGYPATAAGKKDAEEDLDIIKESIRDDQENNRTSKYEAALSQLGQAAASFVVTSLVADLKAIPIPDAPTCSVTDSGCGVIYRNPAAGRIRVCQGSNTEQCKRLVAENVSILFQEDRLIPQFGQMMSLPLKNGPFTNNALSAEFAENGQILEMSYKKPNAEAVAAASSVNEGIGGITELITYKNGRELQKLKDKQVLYEAQLNTQNALDKLSPSEVAKLQDEKALVDAQIAVADAQRRAEGQPSQVTQLENETLFLEAKIKQTQTLIKLKQAEKELEELSD